MARCYRDAPKQMVIDSLQHAEYQRLNFWKGKSEYNFSALYWKV